MSKGVKRKLSALAEPDEERLREEAAAVIMGLGQVKEMTFEEILRVDNTDLMDKRYRF